MTPGLCHQAPVMTGLCVTMVTGVGYVPMGHDSMVGTVVNFVLVSQGRCLFVSVAMGHVI